MLTRSVLVKDGDILVKQRNAATLSQGQMQMDFSTKTMTFARGWAGAAPYALDCAVFEWNLGCGHDTLAFSFGEHGRRACACVCVCVCVCV